MGASSCGRKSNNGANYWGWPMFTNPKSGTLHHPIKSNKDMRTSASNFFELLKVVQFLKKKFINK
jgi:hypothetical protein